MKKDTKELLDTLSSGPVQRYILENENQDVRQMVLKNKVLFTIPAAQLSGQIASRRKAKEKLPLYYNTAGIIYPPPANLEQSSSEATAILKAEIMRDLVTGRDAICADLTGGFGVDTYFFSKIVKTMHYVEPELSLLEIARHNHQLLGSANIEYHASTAEQVLENMKLRFDFVFIDPSRRGGTGKRVHALADSLPDIIALKDKVLETTPLLVVKASPLLDLQAGITELLCVKMVWVISVRNECKEVLFLCERDFDGIASIEAVNIRENKTLDTFSFTFPEEHAQKIQFSDPLNYLYEPNASVLKAGAFKTTATRFNLKKIAPNTHLYTGTELFENFPGRTFEIEKLVKSDRAEVQGSFPQGQANVITRNYPVSPENLKKKMDLTDGGEKFLIGFSGQRRRFLAVAKRLKSL